MRLSNLQKYILKKVWNSNKLKVNRYNFNSFYNQKKKNPKKNLQIKIIPKSIERLIERGLLIGFGEKTQYKLMIMLIKRLQNLIQTNRFWPKPDILNS